MLPLKGHLDVIINTKLSNLFTCEWPEKTRHICSPSQFLTQAQSHLTESTSSLPITPPSQILGKGKARI